MRFTTLSFLLFFVAFYFLYWVTSGRLRFYLVIVSSFIFYAAWSLGFALHFLLVVLINFALIYRLHDTRSRALLTLTVSLNLANLFFFKYFYLLIKIIYDVSGAASFTPRIFNDWLYQKTGFQEIILPLAISFYTFQLIAYTVDTYRGQIPERATFTRFMVFTLFFPHFVAGPIMRHSDFVPQLDNIRPSAEKMIEGMFLILIGLIKKVVVADNMSAAISDVFLNPFKYDWVSTTLAGFGYTVRVYCDFSGYTDIARGLAKLMGLELPENFKAPFLARSIRELWQRWHITLATFLRDYIYIPIGGSRVSGWRVYLNTVITFTLGGIWHGANYTYFLWGLFHGLMIGFERAWASVAERLGWTAGIKHLMDDSEPGARARMTSLATSTVTLCYVITAFTIGAVFFNAPTATNAFIMLKQSFTGGHGVVSTHNGYIAGMLVILYVFNVMQQKKKWPSLSPAKAAGLVTALGLVTVMLLGRFAPGGADFIYFQF
ncbi:MAG: MBOAT family protein [Spirochaetia bacterium]|nr:MBOAT family protein [Spirochaetia bacterium]